MKIEGYVLFIQILLLFIQVNLLGLRGFAFRKALFCLWSITSFLEVIIHLGAQKLISMSKPTRAAVL